MRHSTRIIPAFVAAALASTSALAADFPVKAVAPVAYVPSSTWTGFYVGLNGGGGFGSTSARTFGLLGAALNDPGATGSYNLGHNLSGGFGGVQAGVNVQTGSFVWGVEADIQAADIRGTGRVSGVAVTQVNGVGANAGNFTLASQRIDSFGTIRARAGFLAAPNLLLYGTGGFMGADLRTTGNFFFAGAPRSFAATKDGFAAGYTVGAGFEYKWTQNWSVKGEYLYYDLGNRSLVSDFGQPTQVPTFQTQYNFSTHGSLARIGVNYQWNVDPARSAFAADMPVKAVRAIAPISLWQVEVGARYFYSNSRTQYTLFDPFTRTQLNSRLTYKNMGSSNGEAFARVDHASGFFAKGFLGGGRITNGTLNDEDFPPAVAPYSNTVSSIRNGSQYYGTIDAGWNFMNTPTAKVGAFVGYNRLYQNANGYGCQQVATNAGICGVPISSAVLVLSKTETWDALRVGLNTVYNFAPQWKVTLDGAYLPYVSLSGFDNHWLRPDINPLPQAGRGWGYQLEGILAYDVTQNMSVGVGGRYAYARAPASNATTQFPGVPSSPTTFTYDRYGGFLQASYKFGDPPLMAKY